MVIIIHLVWDLVVRMVAMMEKSADMNVLCSDMCGMHANTALSEKMAAYSPEIVKRALFRIILDASVKKMEKFVFDPTTTIVYCDGTVDTNFYDMSDVVAMSSMMNIRYPVTTACGIRRMLRYWCIWRKTLCAKTTESVSDIDKGMVSFTDSSVNNIKYSMTDLPTIMKQIANLKTYVMTEKDRNEGMMMLKNWKGYSDTIESMTKHVVKCEMTNDNQSATITLGMDE